MPCWPAARAAAVAPRGPAGPAAAVPSAFGAVPALRAARPPSPRPRPVVLRARGEALGEIDAAQVVDLLDPHLDLVADLHGVLDARHALAVAHLRQVQQAFLPRQ